MKTFLHPIAGGIPDRDGVGHVLRTDSNQANADGGKPVLCDHLEGGGRQEAGHSQVGVKVEPHATGYGSFQSWEHRFASRVNQRVRTGRSPGRS